jgi:Ni/Co efflux regulator RcnB
MKTKLLIAAAVAATFSPMAAQAQTRELQRDKQEIREERGELRQAKRFGDRSDIREEREELRDAKQEYREDRRDYRDDKRRAYHAPRFDAPFRYRSFHNGASIGTGYYAPRYYVSNYSGYRLPAPNRNQRYVRHYDDVLLVNVRSGKVVRVYRNFF